MYILRVVIFSSLKSCLKSTNTLYLQSVTELWVRSYELANLRFTVFGLLRVRAYELWVNNLQPLTRNPKTANSKPDTRKTRN